MTDETATTIGDAMIFVAIVAVVILVGIAVGMIVAGRLDRIMAPRPPAGDGTAPEPDPDPAPAVDPQDAGDPPGTAAAIAEEEHR